MTRVPTESSRPVTAPTLAPGDVLGGYRVLAARGMSLTDIDPRGFTMEAALYRAEDVASGMPVLLKVFTQPYAEDDPFAQGFVAEARRVAAFVHPHIVWIYNAGLDRGCLYLATQVVDGGTLLDRMQAGGLSQAQMLALLAPLAQALDAAHAAGLVYGEITPGTVRIDAAGVPRLDHFAVARRLPGTGIAGVRLTDISYAAPEVRGGLGRTAASDVYALTAVLAYCLTGMVPVPEDAGASSLFGRLSALLHRSAAGRASVPQDSLEAVIARGLASDPAHRYTNAEALIGAVAPVVGVAAPAVPAAPASAALSPQVPAAAPSAPLRAVRAAGAVRTAGAVRAARAVRAAGAVRAARASRASGAAGIAPAPRGRVRRWWPCARGSRRVDSGGRVGAGRNGLDDRAGRAGRDALDDRRRPRCADDGDAARHDAARHAPAGADAARIALCALTGRGRGADGGADRGSRAVERRAG